MNSMSEICLYSHFSECSFDRPPIPPAASQGRARVRSSLSLPRKGQPPCVPAPCCCLSPFGRPLRRRPGRSRDRWTSDAQYYIFSNLIVLYSVEVQYETRFEVQAAESAAISYDAQTRVVRIDSLQANRLAGPLDAGMQTISNPVISGGKISNLGRSFFLLRSYDCYYQDYFNIFVIKISAIITTIINAVIFYYYCYQYLMIIICYSWYDDMICIIYWLLPLL